MILPLNMVPFMDVDDYLHQEHYRLCINDYVWPWEFTHFIKRLRCFMCHIPTYTEAPTHFILLTNAIAMELLISTEHFWCQNCKYAVYEHHLPDECECCAL